MNNCLPVLCSLQIKTSWRDVPNNSNAVSRLSSELKDLLDKMFEVKQVGAGCGRRLGLGAMAQSSRARC